MRVGKSRTFHGPFAFLEQPTDVKKDRTECAVLFALTLRFFFTFVGLIRTRSCSWAPAE